MTDTTNFATDEPAARIKYDARTIRERSKDSVLLEGIHYIRLFVRISANVTGLLAVLGAWVLIVGMGLVGEGEVPPWLQWIRL